MHFYLTDSDNSFLANRGSYSPSTETQRAALIRLVIDKRMTIKDASNKVGVKYSTGKSILNLYQRTGRVSKKFCNDGRPDFKERQVSKEQNSNELLVEKAILELESKAMKIEGDAKDVA